MRYRRFNVWIGVLCIAFAASLAGAQNATINYAAPQQTIRGFGGATAWLEN